MCANFWIGLQKHVIPSPLSGLDYFFATHEFDTSNCKKKRKKANVNNVSKCQTICKKMWRTFNVKVKLNCRPEWWNNTGGLSCTECNNCAVNITENSRRKEMGTHMLSWRLYTLTSPANVIFHLEVKICCDDHAKLQRMCVYVCVRMCVSWLSHCVVNISSEGSYQSVPRTAALLSARTICY